MISIAETKKYRSRWACFDCRKSFTRIRSGLKPFEVKCPDCQKKATDMGYLFKAPPKRDHRRWKIMEILGKHCIRFDSIENAAYINDVLTDNNRLSPKVVEQNVELLLHKHSTNED